MRTPSTVLAGALLLTAALASSPAAHAERGWLNVKNCSNLKVDFLLYDWNDAAQASARSKMYLDPGETDRRSCRRSWSRQNAPGCKARASSCQNGNSNCHGIDFGRVYSGDYTIWTERDVDGETYHHFRSGIASDCNGNNPNQFTLSGDWESRCRPKMVIYGNPDKSGESYVLDNMRLGDMTKLRGPDEGSLNDWVRALEVHSDDWLICEHTEGSGGQCKSLYGGNWDVALDTEWNGWWDRRISYISPLYCDGV